MTSIAPETKQKILAFLKTQNLGVIATNSATSQSPESAVVGFSETENLEIVFSTSSETRKYQNLMKHPHVSFVIGWSFGKENKNVQFEGKAELISNDEREKYMQQHIGKNPGSSKFAQDPKQCFFKVAPSWIRYSDFTVVPNEVHEFGFES